MQNNPLGQLDTGTFYKVTGSADQLTLETVAISLRQEELQSNVQDRNERKLYAKRIFWMLCWWIIGIYFLILLQGISIEYLVIDKPKQGLRLHFNLSNEVILALITTTTINIAAFFLAVTKYLFPERRKSDG